MTTKEIIRQIAKQHGVTPEQVEADNYLVSESWVSKVKTKTDILQFSNGLLDSGEYILITAGG